MLVSHQVQHKGALLRLFYQFRMAAADTATSKYSDLAKFVSSYNLSYTMVGHDLSNVIYSTEHAPVVNTIHHIFWPPYARQMSPEYEPHIHRSYSGDFIFCQIFCFFSHCRVDFKISILFTKKISFV